MSPRSLWIVAAALLSMSVVLGCGEVTEYADDADEAPANSEAPANNEAPDGGGSSVEPDDSLPADGGRVATGVSVSTGSGAPFSSAYRCTSSAPLPQGDAAGCAEHPEPWCEGNTPPRLGFPSFLVDGELVEELGRVPATSRIALLIPFEDDECNLACGATTGVTNFSGQSHSNGGGGGEQLSPHLGCSSAETGLCFTLWMYTEAFLDAPEGALDWSEADLWVVDACGARSNEVSARLDFR